MIPPFDIFQVDPKDGALLWCESADSLDHAKQRIEKLSQRYTVQQFVIVSLQTGNRVVVPAGPPESTAPA